MINVFYLEAKPIPSYLNVEKKYKFQRQYAILFNQADSKYLGTVQCHLSLVESLVKKSEIPSKNIRLGILKDEGIKPVFESIESFFQKPAIKDLFLIFLVQSDDECKNL